MNSLPKQADPDNPNSFSGPLVNIPVSAISGSAKEIEPPVQIDAHDISEYPAEFEPTPELQKIGVTTHRDQIDVPPDVAAMGVQSMGVAQPHTYTGAVQLPLTDDQIVVGLHAQIISSLRWLAEWCVKQLKRAHIHLRSKDGSVIREKDKSK